MAKSTFLRGMIAFVKRNPGTVWSIAGKNLRDIPATADIPQNFTLTSPAGYTWQPTIDDNGQVSWTRVT